MATSIATSHGLTQTQWDSQLYKTYQEMTFFGKFKGTSPDSIIQVKRDLQKKPGDALVFAKSGSIRGTSGVAGNNVLGEGTTSNEQGMVFQDQRITIDQIRQGIALAGLMDEKRTAISLRNEAKTQLTDWMSYNEDAAIFAALNTSDAVLTAHTSGTGLTYDAIVDMKKEAMFPTFGNVDATTDAEVTTQKLKPIKIEGGEEYFVLGVNPSDAAAFRKSTDFKTFNQYAGVRGKSNALFVGSLGIWNNVVVHEHSSFVAGAPVLMGAQAAFLAYGKEIMYGERTADYDNQTGFMIGSVRGVALAKFLNEADEAQGSNGSIKFNIAS